MRRPLIFGITTLIAVLLCGCSSSNAVLDECYSTAQFKKMVLPAFSWYVMNVSAQEQSRIDLYLQMPYKKLRFQVEDFNYRASYTYTILIRGANGELVQTKEFDRTVSVRTYEESVSLRSDFSLQTFVLSPGSYKVEIQSRDNHSQLMYRIVQSLGVKNFTGPSPAASSVLLLDTITYDAKGIILRPVLPEYVSLLSGSLGTFQEIYNVHAGDTVTISTQYTRVKEVKQEAEKVSSWMPPYRLRAGACTGEKKESYFSFDSSFIASGEGTIQYIQSYPLPEPGRTIIQRLIRIHSVSRDDSVNISLSIFRRDPSFKFSPSTEEILFALRFIAREEEVDSLAAVTGDAQTKKIAEYWNLHGGSQRQFDFEKRVQEANQFFTSCTVGSKTPMGIVYIICGIPDYVDCRSALAENWYYTIGERTFAVQFRRSSDQTDSPYFELMPFSVSDTFWQYCIDQWRKKN